MSETYNEAYYKSSNYADYLERADRYRKTAHELVDLLSKLSLVNKESSILDFGCAVGFLVEALNSIGYGNATGYEISEWALSEAKKKGLKVTGNLRELMTKSPDVLFALDVFEHMTDKEIREALNLLIPRAMVVRIPSSVDGGKTFALEVSRQDKTHINCKTKDQWVEFFSKLGFHTFLRINLFTVYDTPGVSCLLIL